MNLKPVLVRALTISAVVILFLTGLGALTQAGAASTALPSLPTKACTTDDYVWKNCTYDPSRHSGAAGKAPAYIADATGRVQYLRAELNNPAKRATFERRMFAKHWERTTTVDGHRLCFARYGETTRFECFDGYRTTS